MSVWQKLDKVGAGNCLSEKITKKETDCTDGKARESRLYILCSSEIDVVVTK